MANRYPLVANASTLTIQELPSNDTLLVDNLTSTGNLSVAGNSNLGLVSTVIITGGANGQYLQTDGSGNLSWTTLTVNTDSISNGNSNVAVASSGGNVGISVAGNANVVKVTGSDVFVTGNITPTANLTYSLGNNTNRWNNLYLSGNTIVLGDATITTTGNAIVMTNPDGGNFTIAGNTDASTSDLSNGTSNVNIPVANGNILISSNGVANVMVVTGTGANITGTLNVSGNANAAALGVSGNVQAAYFIGNGSQLTGIDATAIQNGNANVKTYANGNVAISAAGSGNIVVVTSTGANISGYANITGNAAVGNLTATDVTATTLGGSLTTNAQPNITSVGTLTSLTVTGNISAGNISATNISGNVSGAANTAGTVTTNAQPNITSVGTLTSLSVSGNVSAGNVSATLVTGTLTTGAQPNITSLGTLTSALSSGNITAEGNLISDNLISRTGLLTLSASGSNQDVDIKPTGTGVVDVWGARISNIGTPTQSSDAATKQYVDDVAQGLNIHDSCQAATTGTLATATGGTITYNNGSSGVGATLTTTGSYTTIDGVNVTTVGTRILVKNEANAAHNGIYTYTSSTVITRATDFNTVPEVEAGDFVFITGGTTYDNTGWVQTSAVTTIGTDNIEFAQFSGAGTYQAGTGLTLSGTTFNISNTTITAASYGNGDYVATFTVNAQGQLTAAANTAITANAANLTGATLASSIINSSLTSVGTLTSLSVTGNISAGNVSATTFTGNLTGNASNATNAGTVTTAAQPNITSVGTLTSLAVTGNVTAGNLYANSGTVGASLVAGTLTTAAQPNVTSVGTLSSLGVSGTITAANITANTGVFTGNGASLTNLNGSNISSGTIAQARLANSSMTVNGTSISLGGSATVTASTTNSITFNNGGAGGASGQTFNGGSAVTVSYNTIGAPSTTGTNASGSWGISVTGSAATAGTVTTAAQPNITSVGTLSSLAVTGNITAGNLTCSSGTVTAATLTETSSITIKENFRPIENPLDVIMQLVGHIYDRKDGTTKGEAGLVAEEVAQILPNLVGLDSKGNPDSVKYSRLTVYLLESIKVLKDEIDSLKGKKRKTKK